MSRYSVFYLPDVALRSRSNATPFRTHFMKMLPRHICPADAFLTGRNRPRSPFIRSKVCFPGQTRPHNHNPVPHPQYRPHPKVVQTIPRRKVAGIKEGLNVCQHCNAEVFSICTIRCIPKSISQNSASTCRFKLFDILIKQSIHKQFFRIRTSEPSEK